MARRKEYDNHNTIALFKPKTKNSKAPQLSGTIKLSQELVDDLVKQLDAGDDEPKLGVVLWLRESNDGLKFYSGAINEYEEYRPKRGRKRNLDEDEDEDDEPRGRSRSKSKRREEEETEGDLDDEIPF